MSAAPRRRTRAGARLCVLAVAVPVLLAGCGDDGSEAGGPSSGTSSSAAGSGSASAEATATPSGSSSGSSSTEPSAAASPTVAPATGERVEGRSFSFVVPEGFTGNGATSGGLAGGATFSDLTTTFCVIDASENANLGGAVDLEGAAALQLESNPDLTRLPDREVGGEQVFVFEGDAPTGTEHLVGRVAGDQIAELSFTFAPESVRGTPVDPAAEDALVESVLATVEWTA